jgi:hypothetical protein
VPLRFAFRIETAAVIILLKRSGPPLIVPSVLNVREHLEVGQAVLQNDFSAGEMRYDCSSPQAPRQGRRDRGRDRRLRTSPKMAAVVRLDRRAKKPELARDMNT